MSAAVYVCVCVCMRARMPRNAGAPSLKSSLSTPTKSGGQRGGPGDSTPAAFAAVDAMAAVSDAQWEALSVVLVEVYCDCLPRNAKVVQDDNEVRRWRR